MAKLDSRTRAKLPDRAFAYIDSKGRRRLPINDEAHVRNALSRFNRVSFESDAAREQARNRLLKAAKKFGIVPVGFITRELEAERRRAAVTPRTGRAAHAAAEAAAPLPTGFVTLMMTDIESSTALLRKLGVGYSGLLDDVRGILRAAVDDAGGREIDVRADDGFAIFERAADAVAAAAALQRGIAGHTWPDGVDVRVRVGLHSGTPSLTHVGYIGLAVHTVARVCDAAHGGQILVSGGTVAAAGDTAASGIRFRSVGRHRLAGLADAEELFQVEAEGLAAAFAPPRGTGRRSSRASRT